MRGKAVLGFLLCIAAPAAFAVGAGSANAAPSLLSTTRVTLASSFTAPSQFAGSMEFDPTNISSIGGYAHPDHLSLSMGGGTANRRFSIDLQAPTGHSFQVGTYFGDDVYGVRGMASMSEGDETCSEFPFTITDIALAGTSIVRLDVRFQTTCNLNLSHGSLAGELLLGEPTPAGIMTGTRSPAWPEVPIGTRSAALLPLWVRNTGSNPMVVGTVARTGISVADFPVVTDGCSHRTLGSHASCLITIAFAPRASGTRTALVTVPIGGVSVSTLLTGTGPTGRTLFRATSQPGDYVGGGRSYLYTDAQAPIRVAHKDPSVFVATLNEGTQTVWMVNVHTLDGRAISVGTHRINSSANSGPDYGVNITGGARGCSGTTGSVTVTQATFNADGAPTAFDMTFTQQCLFGTGTLTGEIAYRATTPIAPTTAPWILHGGQLITAGHSITNTDELRTYYLTVRSTGQVVLYQENGATLWSTPTRGSGTANRLTVRSDGSLALLTKAGAVVWSIKPAGAASGDFLVLQSDGNLVLDNAAYQPLWSTGTAQ